MSIAPQLWKAVIIQFRRTVKEFQEFRVNTYTVIYWPSTVLSIKWSTCVNKRKNSGSRCTLDNNITRCQDGSSQLETICRSESQRQTEGFGPSMTHGWATQPRWGRSAAVVARRTWVNITVCPGLPLISHTQQTSTLSRIKCERYIFIKKCVRSFIGVRILCLIMSLLIFVLRVYNNSSIQHYPFVRTQLKRSKYCYVTLNSHLLAHSSNVQTFYFTHRTLSDPTSPGHSGPGNSGNEVISHILQSSWAGDSLSDGFMLNPGHSIMGRGLTPLQECSRYILLIQLTWLNYSRRMNVKESNRKRLRLAPTSLSLDR